MWVRCFSSEGLWVAAYPRIAAALGDHELTLSMLQSGIQDGQASVIGAGTDPLFAFMADDPQFKALVEQFNLPVIMP